MNIVLLVIFWTMQVVANLFFKSGSTAQSPSDLRIPEPLAGPPGVRRSFQ